MRDGTPVAVFVTLELAFRLPMSYPVPAGLALPATPATDDEFFKGASSETPGLVLPKLLKNAAPPVPREAMNAKIQGTVEVEMVVGTDGNVLRSRIKRSLDTK